MHSIPESVRQDATFDTNYEWSTMDYYMFISLLQDRACPREQHYIEDIEDRDVESDISDISEDELDEDSEIDDTCALADLDSLYDSEINS